MQRLLRVVVGVESWKNDCVRERKNPLTATGVLRRLRPPVWLPPCRLYEQKCDTRSEKSLRSKGQPPDTLGIS
jgi:hypothetical protein